MRLSAFGEKFAGRSGIVDLMTDLGEALRADPSTVFMGGGNPARIPAVETTLQQHIAALLGKEDQWQRLFGLYQAPGGDKNFRETMAGYLSATCGWDLSADNIAVSNGSQSAYFVLYNLFAGPMSDGSSQRIHLPLVPEYVGYADAGLAPDFFSSTRPEIELLADRQFKYHVNFSQLELDDGVGALCVSRPTNPTGNVLTETELTAVAELAAARDIPLIIDGAYGGPFPDITFTDATPYWDSNTILTLSLSKLGLPGVRTGIVVARSEVIAAFNSASTIISLASGSLGPVLTTELLSSGAMQQLTHEHIRPFYAERLNVALDSLHHKLDGLPWRVHRPEGGFFLWLWFENLPVSSADLYSMLKSRGLLAIPGESFFIGTDNSWQHSRECLRLSYAQDPETIKLGVGILGGVLRELYGLHQR